MWIAEPPSRQSSSGDTRRKRHRKRHSREKPCVVKLVQRPRASDQIRNQPFCLVLAALDIEWPAATFVILTDTVSNRT